jgi:hypothetical protein
MDVSTGFEIFWVGNLARSLEDASVISPARGGSNSYGDGMWAIAHLNPKLHEASAAVFENFPNLCSPMLEAALLTKTSP